MTELVRTNFRFKKVDEIWPLRPRPDEAHIAAQNIEHLRDFIEPSFTYKCAYSGNSGISLLRPNGTIFLGVLTHRAEFEQREWAASQADPFLFKNDWTRRLQSD